MSLIHLSRRQFLKSTGIGATGLLLGTQFSLLSHPVFGSGQGDAHALNLFVSIDGTGRIDIICHRSEMGQGIRTGIAQIIADELCAKWSDVNVVQGLADTAYGSQNTDGSRSIRNNYQRMREMGASARTMLEQAAADIWNVDARDVYADTSMVIHRQSKKQLAFKDLVNNASKLTVPQVETLTFKTPQEFALIGKSVPIVDMHKILTGNTEYGQDVMLPDMVFASIERSPVVGTQVERFDKTSPKQVAGVLELVMMPESKIPVLFNPKAGVAVIATNTWAAFEGRKKLNIQWSTNEHSDHNSDEYLSLLKKNIVNKGKVVRSTGDAYQVHENAQSRLDATYTVPYLVHAPMEAPAATAVFKEGQCEIWACTQTPQSTQTNVATALGIEPKAVKVNVTLLGGGFGRKSKPDFSVEAAILAKQLGKPVKVVWSREDEIQHSYYHSISCQHFSASFDDTTKTVTSWIQRTAFPSISWTFNGTQDEPSDGELSLGFGDVPFEVADLSCETHKAPAHTRIGWMRSVSNIHHGFALGSFVDEVAAKLSLPTYETWFKLIGSDRYVDPTEQGFAYSNYGSDKTEYPIDTKRLKAVLKRVVDESNALTQTDDGEGWGISVHRCFTSYVAVATKVKVVDGKLDILEMHSVIDAGLVVNPDRVKSQLEGAMIFGISVALMGEINFEKGAVKQSNFHDYPVARIHQAPNLVKTYIIESDAPPGGVGEPGVPPVAASIANAIFHATGQRIRDLPISQYLRV